MECCLVLSSAATSAGLLADTLTPARFRLRSTGEEARGVAARLDARVPFEEDFICCTQVLRWY
jgi:hypothetical protein